MPPRARDGRVGDVRSLDELAGGVRGDVLALCVDFEGSSDKEGFAAAAARLRSEGMRMLMVHRLRETVPESMLRQGIEYVPRDGLQAARAARAGGGGRLLRP